MTSRVEPSDELTSRSDRIMPADVFRRHRRCILRSLTAPGDPPPRKVSFGTGRPELWIENVVKALDAARPVVLGTKHKTVHRARPIRGFRMYETNVHGFFFWKSVFEILIRHAVGHSVRAKMKPKGGRVSLRLSIVLDERYECPSASPSTCRWAGWGEGGILPKFEQLNFQVAETGFVFVPSSRAHRELSDQDVLSMKYETGLVLDGDSPGYRDAMINHLQLCGRRPSIIGRSPETCTAKERVNITYFPFFKQWLDEEHPFESPDTLAELMGFPVRPYKGNDEEDWLAPFALFMENLQAMTVDEAVEHYRHPSSHAIVDPSCTFALVKRLRSSLSHEDFDEQKQRDMFYKHYELQLERVTMRLFQLSEAQAVERGYYEQEGSLAAG